jgi:hypothetical protein
MNIAENKSRPPSVTIGRADARSFQFGELNARAVCELCDDVEIELVATVNLLGFCVDLNAYCQIDVVRIRVVTLNNYLYL